MNDALIEGSLVSDNEDFVRYFSGGKIDGNRLVTGALQIPASHNGELSVDRLGVYSNDLDTDLTEIRRRSRIALRQTGKLVRWNVGGFLSAAGQREDFAAISIKSDPLPADETHFENPAHALVIGMPSETLAADMLLDLVRPMVRAIYPAKL